MMSKVIGLFFLFYIMAVTFIYFLICFVKWDFVAINEASESTRTVLAAFGLPLSLGFAALYQAVCEEWRGK